MARSGVVLKRRWGRVFVSALQNIKARQQTLPAHAGDHGALLPTEGAVVTCVRRPSCPQRAQIHIKPDFTPGVVRLNIRYPGLL